MHLAPVCHDDLKCPYNGHGGGRDASQCLRHGEVCRHPQRAEGQERSPPWPVEGLHVLKDELDFSVGLRGHCGLVYGDAQTAVVCHQASGHADGHAGKTGVEHQNGRAEALASAEKKQ